jgi:hypothetical protein
MMNEKIAGGRDGRREERGGRGDLRGMERKGTVKVSPSWMSWLVVPVSPMYLLAPVRWLVSMVWWRRWGRVR